MTLSKHKSPKKRKSLKKKKNKKTHTAHKTTEEFSKKPQPKKTKIGKTIIFDDHPEFTPNLMPQQIFELGSFGGTYWRPITSKIAGKKFENRHLEKYPKIWWKNTKHILTKSWDKYDIGINKYGVKVGTTLEFWEDKDWIIEEQPYGWVEWYCDFYMGYRSEDDERQIKRWRGISSDNGRFRNWLITLIKKHSGKYNDINISPKIRQTLQHWAYQLTEKDFNKKN